MSRAPEPVAEQAAPVVEPLGRSGRADEVVLTTLYLQHRGEILSFLLPMTRDHDAAEDILQETFIRLIREARARRMPDNVRAWLYRVAANLAISRGRRLATWLRTVPRLLDRGEATPPEAEVLGHERDREVRAVLSRLRPEARAALLLAAEGFSCGRPIGPVAAGRPADRLTDRWPSQAHAPLMPALIPVANGRQSRTESRPRP